MSMFKYFRNYFFEICVIWSLIHENMHIYKFKFWISAKIDDG